MEKNTRRITLVYVDSKRKKIIKEKLNISIKIGKKKVKISHRFNKNGEYSFDAKKHLEYVCVFYEHSEKYALPKSTKINIKNRNYIEIPVRRTMTYRLKQVSIKIWTLVFGGITAALIGGITIFNLPINISILWGDLSVKWKFDVNENAGASYDCDYCHMYFRPTFAEGEDGTVTVESDFLVTDIPYNYELKLYNDTVIKYLFLYVWGSKEGSDKNISLNHEILRSKSGTYDVRAEEDCTLSAGLSINGDKVVKVDPQNSDGSKELLNNKSSLIDCEENGGCYIGLYYRFEPLRSNGSVYLDPKITYGILELTTTSEEIERFVFVQLKKGQIMEPLSFSGKVNGNNAYLIMTEKEFKERTAFFNFIENDTDFINDMKSKCKEIKEKDLPTGSYSACDIVDDEDNIMGLYENITENLERIKAT